MKEIKHTQINWYAASTSVLIIVSWMVVATLFVSMGHVIELLEGAQIIEIAMSFLGVMLMLLIPFFWVRRLVKIIIREVSEGS